MSESIEHFTHLELAIVTVGLLGFGLIAMIAVWGLQSKTRGE